MTELEWRQSLKVGDKVAWLTHHGTHYAVDTVAKVTKTQVITNHTCRFNIESGREVGGNMRIQEVTPAIRARVRRAQTISVLSGFNWPSLTDDQLARVYAITREPHELNT